MNRLKGEEDLERVTEELTLQLVKKFMQVKSELVRHDGDPSSWTWFYDDRPYPLASSIVQKLGTSSLEERDVIYLIAMAIFYEMKVDRDQNVIKLDGGRLTKKVIERLRAPAHEC